MGFTDLALKSQKFGDLGNEKEVLDEERNGEGRSLLVKIRVLKRKTQEAAHAQQVREREEGF